VGRLASGTDLTPGRSAGLTLPWRRSSRSHVPERLDRHRGQRGTVRWAATSPLTPGRRKQFAFRLYDGLARGRHRSPRAGRRCPPEREDAPRPATRPGRGIHPPVLNNGRRTRRHRLGRGRPRGEYPAGPDWQRTRPDSAGIAAAHERPVRQGRHRPEATANAAHRPGGSSRLTSATAPSGVCGASPRSLAPSSRATPIRATNADLRRLASDAPGDDPHRSTLQQRAAT
jgi:hypothetical protein